MLYINRRVGESVIIDDDIILKIIRNQNGEVTIGFDAPEDIEIWREEIYQRRMDDDSRRD